MITRLSTPAASLLGLLLLAGCTPITRDEYDAAKTLAGDEDGDGYVAASDCDDGRPDVHPGAAEHCDGVDEDCDGLVDDAPSDPGSWLPDTDGDGYGDDAQPPVEACAAPDRHVAEGGDCDDAASDVHPGQTDDNCDNVDDDCDGTADDGYVEADAAWVVGYARVGPGPNDASNLADALDRVGDVGTVCVAGGTWDGCGVIGAGQSITIQGATGEAALSGNGECAVIDVVGGELSLSDVAVVGGYGVNGGGISVTGGGVVEANQVRFAENHAGVGGGAYVESSTFEGTDLQFEGNDADCMAAGFEATASDVELTGVVFTGNGPSGLGACTFETLPIGGIRSNSGTVELNGVDFVDDTNGFWSAGELAVAGADRIRLTDVLISGDSEGLACASIQGVSVEVSGLELMDSACAAGGVGFRAPGPDTPDTSLSVSNMRVHGVSAGTPVLAYDFEVASVVELLISGTEGYGTDFGDIYSLRLSNFTLAGNLLNYGIHLSCSSREQCYFGVDGGVAAWNQLHQSAHARGAVISGVTYGPESYTSVEHLYTLGNTDAQSGGSATVYDVDDDVSLSADDPIELPDQPVFCSFDPESVAEGVSSSAPSWDLHLVCDAPMRAVLTDCMKDTPAEACDAAAYGGPSAETYYCGCE